MRSRGRCRPGEVAGRRNRRPTRQRLFKRRKNLQPGRRRMGLRASALVVLMEPVVKRLEADSQNLRGFFLVAAAPLQGPEDEMPLGFLEGPSSLGRSRRWAPPGDQVRELDHVLVNDESPL